MAWVPTVLTILENRQRRQKCVILVHSGDCVQGSRRLAMDKSSQNHYQDVCLVPKSVSSTIQRNYESCVILEGKTTMFRHYERVKVIAQFPLVFQISWFLNMKFIPKQLILCVSLFRPRDWNCCSLHQSRGNQAADKQTQQWGTAVCLGHAGAVRGDINPLTSRSSRRSVCFPISPPKANSYSDSREFHDLDMSLDLHLHVPVHKKRITIMLNFGTTVKVNGNI